MWWENMRDYKPKSDTSNYVGKLSFHYDGFLIDQNFWNFLRIKNKI